MNLDVKCFDVMFKLSLTCHILGEQYLCYYFIFNYNLYKIQMILYKHYVIIRNYLCIIGTFFLNIISTVVINVNSID